MNKKILGAMLALFVGVETPRRVANNIRSAHSNMDQVIGDYRLDCDGWKYQIEQTPAQEAHILAQRDRKKKIRDAEVQKQQAYLEQSFLHKICRPPTPFYMDDD